MQTPWGDLSVEDAHVHFFSHRFFSLLAPDIADPWQRLGWHEPPRAAADFARVWEQELTRNGVSRAAMIASLPADAASVIAAAEAVPDRFYRYLMVNPTAQDPSQLTGADAICLFPAMHRYSIGDAAVTPFLHLAAQQNLTVFVHCGVLTVGVRKKLGLASQFDLRYSNPIDLHPVATAYPKVNFVLPHFGAGYLREALMLADMCPNVYLDTSSSNSWMRYSGVDLKEVFRRSMAAAGATRLLFGTDSSFFPRGWNKTVFDAQVAALWELGVGATDAAAIFGGNLRRLMSAS